jgi:hypothetical protein
MSLGVRNATALLRATLANSVSLSVQNRGLQTYFCRLKMYCVEHILKSEPQNRIFYWSGPSGAACHAARSGARLPPSAACHKASAQGEHRSSR